MAALDSSKAPSDSDLKALLDSPSLNTGLDHWHLWTLVCLDRHLGRQKWVGYVVETRLKGDPVQLGRCGSIGGHPEDIPQSGKVPGEPGWRYFFHGIGCCLTNKADGSCIDVDFTPKGANDRIDCYFYSRFLDELKRPEFPERQLQRKDPFQHAWQANLAALTLAGCLTIEEGIHITQFGRDLVHALEPVLDRITELDGENSVLAARRMLYAALALGDLILSRQVAQPAGVEDVLAGAIARAAEEIKNRRAARLIERLGTKEAQVDSCALAALADLGPRNAKSVVEHFLYRTPVDSAATEALAILLHWDEPDTAQFLENLIELRHTEAVKGRSLVKGVLRARSEKDKLPRKYQIVRAVLGLVQRSRPGRLKPQLRENIISLLESSGTASSGEAALLLHVIDPKRGLKGLRTALSGTVPGAQTEAAAACVIIGSRSTERILIEALDNPDLHIQHTAACGLQRFPTRQARERAAQWFARLDGIDSPTGKAVPMMGRTITAYTTDDILHANMDAFFSGELDRLREDFGPVLSQLR